MSRTVASLASPYSGAIFAKASTLLAHPTGASSNPLFQILQDWGEVLKHTSLGNPQTKPAQNDDEPAKIKLASNKTKRAKRAKGWVF